MADLRRFIQFYRTRLSQQALDKKGSCVDLGRGRANTGKKKMSAAYPMTPFDPSSTSSRGLADLDARELSRVLLGE